MATLQVDQLFATWNKPGSPGIRVGVFPELIKRRHL